MIRGDRRREGTRANKTYRNVERLAGQTQGLQVGILTTLPAVISLVVMRGGAREVMKTGGVMMIVILRTTS